MTGAAPGLAPAITVWNQSDLWRDRPLQAAPELQDPSRSEEVLRPHREARKTFERLREKAR